MTTQKSAPNFGFSSMINQTQPFVNPFENTSLFTPQNTNPHIASWSTPNQITKTSDIIQADKGKIIQALNDSKNIQIEILNELKLLNQKIVTQQTKNIHIGVSCNGCMKTNIYGIRYKCVFCRDFDLCEECDVNLAFTHDPNHSFIKIKNTDNFNMMIQKVPMFNIPEQVNTTLNMVI
jgi:hypothetical protein